MVHHQSFHLISHSLQPIFFLYPLYLLKCSRFNFNFKVISIEETWDIFHLLTWYILLLWFENSYYKSLQIKVYLRSLALSLCFTSTWVFRELHSIPTTWLTLFMVWTDYLVFNLVNNMDHNSLDHDETWILNALDHLNEKNPLHLLLIKK